MALNLNAEIQNLPGMDNRAMNKVLIIRAMTMVTGLYDLKNEPRYWLHQFEPWLKEARGDADLYGRRYSMLLAADLWHHAPEQDPAKVRQAAERLHRAAA